MHLPSNVTLVERGMSMFRDKGLGGEWRVTRRTRPSRQATILHPFLPGHHKGIRPTEVSQVTEGTEVSLGMRQDTSRVMRDLLQGDIRKAMEANMRDAITMNTIITAATNSQPIVM